jgi:hypothetical protein
VSLSVVGCAWAKTESKAGVSSVSAFRCAWPRAIGSLEKTFLLHFFVKKEDISFKKILLTLKASFSNVLGYRKTLLLLITEICYYNCFIGNI